MEWFLRQQAEKLQEKKISVREPALASPVVYFSTWRTTSSDVLSLVTTATPFSRPATWDPPSPQSGGHNTGNAKRSPRSQQRRRGGDGSRQPQPAPFAESKFYSPLCVEGAVNDLERANTNKKLWQEKEKFSTRLRARRVDREILETAAAVKIQALCRGILAQKKVHAQKRFALARARLRRSYMSVVMKLRVKHFVEANVTETRGRAATAVVAIQKTWRRFLAHRLVDKERLALREELLNWAATQLQRLVRKRFAWRATSKLRMRHYEERRANGGQSIQKLARTLAARKNIIRRTALLQYVASTVIQRCARAHLARKASHKERELQGVLRVNASAIPIQAIFRGQLHRRYVRVLRRQEKKDLLFAAALSVQRTYRGHLGRCLFIAERMRSEMEHTVAACIQVQRALKGHHARIAAGEQRASREADLFAQARLGNVRRVQDILAGLVVTDEEYDIGSKQAGTGMTVFMVACRWGHLKLAKRLLGLKADLNASDSEGRTALHYALRYARVLGGVIDGAGRGGNGIAEYLIAKGIHLNTAGRTPLHDAAAFDCEEPIRFLLQKGVDINAHDRPIASGVGIKTSSNGATPLHECATNGHYDCAKLLLERGGDVKAVDDQASTPLHRAAAGGHLRVAQLLVEVGGADLSAQDSDGRTPWRRALVNDHTKVAQFLQKSWSAFIDGTNDLDETHTH
eukprot:INCI3142.3.p1 GENE.INCI3142.3~~INCI3142.3.p1  ORF type:complete len:689 (+),score=97.55 INCI3142.3:181-2247(+)